MQRNIHDILNILVYLFTSYMVVGKLFSIYMHKEEIGKIKEISAHFDKQIGNCEVQKYNLIRFKKKFLVIIAIYISIYGGAALFSGVSTFFYTERRLVFPGYFPYDWQDPNHNILYIMTLAYQVFGFSVHAAANMFQDTFPGFLMYLLATHAKNLKLRISRIGHDEEKTQDENYIELRIAILDYKALIRLFKLTRDTISMGLFGQFLVTSANVVITVVMYMFFTEDLYEGLFYIFLASAYVMEIMLASYYGSVATLSIQDISDGIYSCNWVMQNFMFRKDLKIFLEVSLVTYEFVAGGFISVTLRSFAAIMRSTYSLFAVLNRMGDRFNV